jgi:hypothetical protein
METPAYFPNRTLDYHHGPPGGRLIWEQHGNGFKITMPPLGTWRRSSRKLLFLLLVFITPFAGLRLVIGPSFFGGAARALTIAWHESPASVLLLPFYPLPLIFEFAVISILIGAYFEGRRTTIIKLIEGRLTVTISGRYRSRLWQSLLQQVQPPIFRFGLVRLLSLQDRNAIFLRYGTAAELKWVCKVLSAAQKKEMTSLIVK